jgi:hypothetical protein
MGARSWSTLLRPHADLRRVAALGVLIAARLVLLGVRFASRRWVVTGWG